jgi:hypothetical protein
LKYAANTGTAFRHGWWSYWCWPWNKKPVLKLVLYCNISTHPNTLWSTIFKTGIVSITI